MRFLSPLLTPLSAINIGEKIEYSLVEFSLVFMPKLLLFILVSILRSRDARPDPRLGPVCAGTLTTHTWLLVVWPSLLLWSSTELWVHTRPEPRKLLHRVRAKTWTQDPLCAWLATVLEMSGPEVSRIKPSHKAMRSGRNLLQRESA